MLFVAIYTFMEYLNVFLVYRFLLGVTFKKHIYVYMVTFLPVLLMQILVLHYVDITWKDVIIAGTGFLIPWLWVDKKERRWRLLLLFPVIYLGISLVNTLGSYMIAFMLHKTQKMVIDSQLLTLCSGCTTVLVLFLINRLKKAKDFFLKYTEKVIYIQQYIILIVGLLCFSVLIGFAQYLERDIPYDLSVMKYVGVLLCIVAICFVILSAWQQITLKREKRYRIKTKEYERYMRLQEEHIQVVIEKDENLRRFRHDMRAHIIAMEAIANKDKNEEMLKYIESMKAEAAINAVRQYTGLVSVDAVVSELCHRAEKEGIIINWEGRLCALPHISVYDLCIIFSNLLSNAIEACERIEEGVKKIAVKIYCYENRIFISIKNTFAGKQLNLESAKTDWKNHGFGIRNVQEKVKKYNGELNYYIEEGYVNAEIML